MILYINLLNFHSEKLAGAGYFMRRIFEQIDFGSSAFDKFDKIIILHSAGFDVQTVFSLRKHPKMVLKPVRGMKNFVSRILYEQCLLPFVLMGKKGVYYAPTPVIPVPAKLLSPNILFISTIHDMIPFFIPEKYGRLRGTYIKAMSSASAKYSNVIITVSKSSLNDIVKITGVPASKIKVVYNFLPNTTFKYEENLTPLLLTICTIEPGKNLENTMKGFNRFVEKYGATEYRYVIIGKKGWNFESIFAEKERLSFGDKVHFTGYLSEDEKQAYIEKSSALLYLSKYEGFGIPPLEGMYLGKPSVVSNNSSLPEVVGMAGVICHSADNIEDIADSIHEVIVNRNKYISQIEMQLAKFEPSKQEKIFLDALTEVPH